MSIPSATTFSLNSEKDLSRRIDEAWPKLRASALSKRYGEILAVDQVSFALGPGRALGLLGPNGAGKSTTMLLLAGVLRPDAGEVTVAGESDPTRASVRRLMGYAPQALALYPELTAKENLELIGRLYGLSRANLMERVGEALVLARLEDRANERIGRFSGGMQRRLNLAAATVHRPSVLLLDEPTAGVDPQSRAHIFRCIEQLKRQGVSIVYSTHYLEEAERLCDRIAIMDHGRVLALGSAEELVQTYGQACVAAPPSRLESVFLNLTGRRLRDD